MTPLWQRLRARLRPSAALLSAAVLIAGGFAIASYQSHLFRTQQTRTLSVQAEILAASVTAALSFGDKRTAQEYVDALKINPDIEAAGVFDMRQQMVADFLRPNVKPIPDMPVTPPVNSGAVVAPIEESGTRLGMVYLRAAPQTLDRTSARYAPIVLLTIMAALLLGALGSAQRALTNANDALEERARALALANAQLQQEMSERAATEDALRQSQKMEAVGQLSGGIAHDFNNLLSIIKGNLQLLQRRLSQGKSDVQRYIDSANEGVDRAATLTRRILAFSRRQPLAPKPVLLSELLGGMKDMVRQSIGQRAQMEWDLQAEWPTTCDANQMENLVLNLAINARDAMPEGGTLTIETRDLHLDVQGTGELEQAPPGDYVALTIRDTGDGMTEAVRKRAIDPFFTTKPQGEGTGLGLSMAFGFVRQSNGFMTIESSPGNGTAIKILMPRFVAALEDL